VKVIVKLLIHRNQLKIVNKTEINLLEDKFQSKTYFRQLIIENLVKNTNLQIKLTIIRWNKKNLLWN